MRRRVGKSVADWDDISILKRIGNALFSGDVYKRQENDGAANRTGHIIAYAAA